MKDKKELKIFFAISFLVIGTLILYIFRPLLNTILLGFVFTFLFYPVYKFFFKYIKRPRVSAFLVCLLFILIITIPVFFAINSLAIEVVHITNRFSDVSFLDSMESFKCQTETPICLFIERALNNQFVQTTLQDILSEIGSGSRKYIGEILIALPSIILQIFIIIFMMYYLFIDGEQFINKVRCFIPIKERHKEILFTDTKNVMGGILYGSILVGAVQAILGGLGFYIFGINSAIIWGIMMFFFTFIPFLGTAIIWFPASAYLIINSLMQQDTTGLYRGIGLLIYSALIVSTVDNFIRPKLVSSRTNLHPILVLFGVLGGIFVFNAAGVIIGPLILGIFVTLLEMYDKERNYACSTVGRPTIPLIRKSKKKKRKKK